MSKSPAPKPRNANRTAGGVLTADVQAGGVNFLLDNGHARLDVYGDGLVRVRVSLDEPIVERPSYAVVIQPAREALFTLKEKADGWRWQSDSLVVSISKKAFRLSFEKPDGTVLNADDPAFGSSWLGRECTTYKSLQPEERFMGLGEKTGNLDRRGTAWINWNTDAFAYGEYTDPMYTSTPFYLGVHRGGVYGIFLNNTHRSKFNFGASNNRFAYFSAEDGAMDYFFFGGPDVATIIHDFATLTGMMPMPPKWAIGFQQCRYSYYPDEVVRAKAQAFRRRGIPADVLYLDIHYMERYKVFTWDEKRFPEPEKLLHELQEMGFKVVIIADPGIAREAEYPPYSEGLSGDLFIRYPDGTPYTANVWPGACHFPDFTKPETRTWWAKNCAKFAAAGLGGIWNDMNEPATWGQSMPDLIEFDFDGEGATHKEARNVYGQLMTRATREGMELLYPNERPFILTRSGFAGIQRYAAVWTGDNVASEEHMMLGCRMLANMGLSGMPFTGNDIGGFVGDADPVLFSRWISLGAFSGFFRCHTMINTRDAEPWAYGEKAEEIARNYINLRYRMLPYVYSVFREAAMTGMPVVRSLAIEWPHEARVYQPAFQNQFLFGPSLLVCPAQSREKVIPLFLPEGNWYYLYNDQVHAGNREHYQDCPVDRLPVFVRGGSIIPMQSLVQHAGEMPEHILRLQVYAGYENSSFVWYEDDGKSLDYQKGVYITREFQLDSAKRRLTIGVQRGSYVHPFTRIRIFLHGFGAVHRCVVNGQLTPSSTLDFRYIEQISNFDPFEYVPDPHKEIPDLPVVEFDLNSGEMIVEW